MMRSLFLCVLVAQWHQPSLGFLLPLQQQQQPKSQHGFFLSKPTLTSLSQSPQNGIITEEEEDAMSSSSSAVSRRSLLVKTLGTVAVAASVSVATTNTPLLPILPAYAASEPVSLERRLYLILRVREATQQEQRLIKSGKFKDVQRANVKLAVKFMIENYRLGDNIVGAAAYLKDQSLSMKAIDVGQTAVQDLQTIMEYYDAAEVQNIKVGSST